MAVFDAGTGAAVRPSAEGRRYSTPASAPTESARARQSAWRGTVSGRDRGWRPAATAIAGAQDDQAQAVGGARYSGQRSGSGIGRHTGVGGGAYRHGSSGTNTD